MTWREELRPASFRGVKFFVSSDSSTFGRRVTLHQYPQRDKPFAEDLGRKAREYRFEAFVIGDDYMSQRDAFIEACEQEGPGELIHPKYGSLNVVVSGDCEISESTEYGGMARIRVTFAEAGERVEPGQSVDTLANIAEKKLSLEDRLCEWFGDTFNVQGCLDFVSDDAIACVKVLEEAAGFALDSLSTIRQFVAGDLSILNPDNLITAILAPTELGRGILNLINKAENIYDLADFQLSKKSQSKEVTEETGTTTDISDLTASSRDVQAVESNRQTLETFVKVSYTERILQEKAETITESSSSHTVDEVIEARDEIIELVDEIIFEPTVDAQTVQALLDYRDAVLKHFEVITPQLPKIITVTTKKVQPATVLAYMQYGNDWYLNERDKEIVSRNHVVHPGFVPAGDLEVVAYDE